MKIGFDEKGNYLNKFSFELNNDTYLNRLVWETRLVGDLAGLIKYDQPNLIKSAVHPKENYLQACFKNVPVTCQKFGSLEIDWSDFIEQEDAWDQSREAVHFSPQDLLRVEQSVQKGANIVYFYPEGRKGADEIESQESRADL